MKIEFTGRQFTVSPAIKKHVNEHFKKIDSVLHGAIQAHVILSVACSAFSAPSGSFTWRKPLWALRLASPCPGCDFLGLFDFSRAAQRGILLSLAHPLYMRCEIPA